MPNHAPEEPVVEDRKRRPVLVIRTEEAAQIACGAPGEEHPFIGDEPSPMKVPNKCDEDESLRRDEDPERRSCPRWTIGGSRIPRGSPSVCVDCTLSSSMLLSPA